MNTVTFQFTGGMADNHEMNFYEAGRFQYGAARFLYTLEQFRQKGVVVSKLTTKVKVDIRVKAAKEGSFVQDVIIHASPIIADCALKCSFKAMFAYAWSLILPTSKAKDVAVEIAKLEVAREKQRTLQEGQRTEQIRIMSDVTNNANATTKQTIEILGYAIKKGIILNNDEYQITQDDMTDLRNEALSNLEREEIIKENSSFLSSISPEVERRLSGQLRRSVSDIALPLRSSATGLNISNQDDKTSTIAHLNEASVRSITQELEDDNAQVIRGIFKSYDVENGYGKFRYDELKRPISFRVPSASRSSLREKILDSMKKGDVLISAYFVRDLYKNPVSMILDNILENEAMDDLGFTDV